MFGDNYKPFRNLSFLDNFDGKVITTSIITLKII